MQRGKCLSHMYRERARMPYNRSLALEFHLNYVKSWQIMKLVLLLNLLSSCKVQTNLMSEKQRGGGAINIQFVIH